jgi:hypothetical protein
MSNRASSLNKNREGQVEFVDVDHQPEDTEVEAIPKPKHAKGQYSEISPHELSNSKIIDEKFNDEIYDF